MVYDVIVVLICALSFLVFTNMYLDSSRTWKVHGDIFSSELKANIYWAQFVYGLLSFPFLIFLVPGCDAVVTKARPTAYTKNGVCVPVYVTTESYVRHNGSVVEAEIMLGRQSSARAIIEVDDINYYL